MKSYTAPLDAQKRFGFTSVGMIDDNDEAVKFLNDADKLGDLHRPKMPADTFVATIYFIAAGCQWLAVRFVKNIEMPTDEYLLLGISENVSDEKAQAFFKILVLNFATETKSDITAVSL